MDRAPEGRGERLALVASSLAIGVLVLAQAPGRIIPETKLDVTLDPVGFLGRALSAWDPGAGLGRVQNQAIGYLFPMGAFSALGDRLGIPPWLVQRLWIAGLLLLAFWGAHRLTRALGVEAPAGRVLAAWTYALAPATVSLVAFQSAGQLPYALVPWVLLPLLRARDRDHPRRVAARSTLWLAAMGGVNGASAFAVLPLVLVWFATRRRGPERRRLATWWALGAVAATLWWFIPLLVTVRFGIRFTDYTEAASLTTWTESGTEVLRGTGNWLSFVQTSAGPWLPGARSLTADPVAIVGSTAVAAVGLFGICRRDLPGRSWLRPALVLGVVLMGVGYAGPWGAPFASQVQALLDGPLAPFRNVHKFAAVVRLPLAVGVGHAVSLAVRSATLRAGADGEAARPRPAPAWVRWSAPALVAVAVGLAVAPAAGGRLAAPGSFEDVPAYWRDAASWLDEHDDGGRSLLLPGSSFGEYTWGRPLDEPLASVHEGPWAVRDLIPLGGNGSTRILDGLDRALAADGLPPGTLATLQRAGVRHLVVRNDLDQTRASGPRPASVRRLLATDPDLRRVASFGPEVDDPGSDHRLATPPGGDATDPIRAIEVYEVPGAVDRVAAYPAAGAAVTSGGPEALLQLPPDLVEGRAVVLSVDEGAADLPDPVLVATDTAQRRDVRFGAIRDNTTYVLTADENSPFSGEAPVDRWPAGEPTDLTVARLDGAASITAARELGDPLRPEQAPWRAFDGDPGTFWAVPREDEVGRWLELRFDEPRRVGPMTITLPTPEGTRIDRLRVTTDGDEQEVRFGSDGTATVPSMDGTTDRVRFTIESITGTRPIRRVGIAEVDIDGLRVERPLVVPGTGLGGSDVVSLARSAIDRFNLIRQDEEPVLDRIFGWGGGDEARLSGTATAAAGPALDEALAAVTPAAGDAVTATASSVAGDQPAVGAALAMDGSAATAWVSETEASTPSLTFSWDGAVAVDSLTIDALDGVADPVERVRITVDGTTYDRPLDPGGAVSIPTTVTDELTLAFPRRADDVTSARQVAIAEVTVPALLGRTAPVPDRDATVRFACGDGPPVELDGEPVATETVTTAGVLLDGRPIPWQACDPTEMGSDPHRLVARPGALIVSTVVIEPREGWPPAAPARTVEVGDWGTTRRSLSIGAGDDAIVATTENANEGWTASLDGRRLEPIQVDGWRQGWRVPAGDGGEIRLTYGPDRAQRAGFGFGLLALLGLVALALVPARRGGGWTAPSDGTWGRPAAVGVLAVAAVALGGPLGLVAVPLALLPHRDRWLPRVAAAAVVAAGAIALAQPGADVGDTTGTFSAPAQALAVTAILAVAAALLDLAARRSDEAS